MTNQSGPIYEVTLFLDREIIEESDRWLEDHVRAALREPGIVDCNVFAITDDADGRARRICLHVLASDEALEDFLEGSGTDLEAQLAAQFGEQIASTNRVLREDQSPVIPAGESADCLNCGARLKGQYCGHCGQRSRGRLISLWELISDAFGDLLEIDSRLWQTLIPLMIRPGRLTHDYLQGRRARYMPPFRMYLVLSLLFFVVAFFDPREELGLLFEPQAETVSDESIDEALQDEQDILDELVEDGVIAADDVPDNLEFAGGSFNFEIDGDDDDGDGDCNVDASDLEELPAWIARRLTVERLQRVCERTRLDDGRALADNLLDNVPAALIVLLPLMALALRILYPLSKRYYVEHLLFFVHFHAFFFLMLSLQILYVRVTALLGAPEGVSVVPVVIASFYVPVYLFVSMRRVYGQGRFVTFLKYIVLLIAYLLGFFATMLGALAIAAFSI